jgi:hypothetical protein
MIVGVTGTDKGMALKQRLTVFNLFESIPVNVIHHGDCIGADATFHETAQYYKAFIAIHPPDNPSKRAFCVGADQTYPKKSYLKRNKDIVEKGRDGLIAAPEGYVEILRDGTWSTIRYARKLHRHIWIVFPDGTIREEN